MAEILHHLVCKNPTNNGRSYLSTGAGFQPSTVVMIMIMIIMINNSDNNSNNEHNDNDSNDDNNNIYTIIVY